MPKKKKKTNVFRSTPSRCSYFNKKTLGSVIKKSLDDIQKGVPDDKKMTVKQAGFQEYVDNRSNREMVEFLKKLKFILDTLKRHTLSASHVQLANRLIGPNK